MDADRKELVRRLFVLATEIAEAAHETAVSGQALSAPSAELALAAETLRRRADKLGAIGRTITIASGGATTENPARESS
jgi:hypothetical protein